MFSGLMEGMSLITPELFMWIAISVFLGTILSILPGLGGIVGVAIMLPVAVKLGPEVAIAILIPLLAVSGTGNTITAVIFGVPGTADSMATIFDGHKMARAGMATRAITAGATASAVGGVLGALVLLALLPLMRTIVLALGIPEFFALVVVAILMLGFLIGDNVVKGLSAGLFGMLLSYVGLDASTGTPRYTFGILFLRDSIPLVSFFIGVFAIAQMMILLRKGGAIARPTDSSAGTHFAQVLQGVADVFRRWRATCISSLVGVGVGTAPGLGGSVAQFMAYTQCMNLSKVRDNYGKGEVEGVIAADAATNSTNAGALVPTFALGIPGSAGMALVVLTLESLGIRPGEELVTTNVHFIWLTVIVFVLSNVMASVLTVGLAAPFAKLTLIPTPVFAGLILVVCFFGAYASTGSMGGIVTAVAGGLLGYVMVQHNYSRVMLVIGFVLGAIAEHYLLLSIRIYGAEFLLRPGALAILGGGLLLLLGPMAWRSVRKRERAGVRA